MISVGERMMSWPLQRPAGLGTSTARIAGPPRKAPATPLVLYAPGPARVGEDLDEEVNERLVAFALPPGRLMRGGASVAGGQPRKEENRCPCYPA
jgi:hypothetical protein